MAIFAAFPGRAAPGRTTLSYVRSLSRLLIHSHLPQTWPARTHSRRPVPRRTLVRTTQPRPPTSRPGPSPSPRETDSARPARTPNRQPPLGNRPGRPVPPHRPPGRPRPAPSSARPTPPDGVLTQSSPVTSTRTAAVATRHRARSRKPGANRRPRRRWPANRSRSENLGSARPGTGAHPRPSWWPWPGRKRRPGSPGPPSSTGRRERETMSGSRCLR